MAEEHFFKVEHETGDTVRIHIVHAMRPKMVVEFNPRYSADGKISGGSIKRICVENSPTGQYHLYGKVVRQAEKFFYDSLVMTGATRG